MPNVKLPCAIGGDCDYETINLPYEQAKDQLEIHMMYAHRDAQPVSSNKPEKFPRPEIKLDSTAENWEEFIVTWAQYKEEYKLAGAGLVRQLIASCSDELKQSLSRLTGGKHFTLTEAQLLDHMKNVAVRYQNPAVFVQQFLSLSQQQDEGVRHYLTRLRGLASRCNFTVKCEPCNTELSYADSVIRFKLIAGLCDEEIKEDVLSSQEDKSLEDTVKEIEAKESGKLARKTVGASTTAKVQVAGEINETKVATGSSTRACGHCGRYGHSSEQSDREKNCPAFNKSCNKCGKTGHFKDMCRSGRRTGKRTLSVKEEETLNNAFIAEEKSYKPDDFKLMSVTFGEIAALMYCMKNVTKEMKSINKVKIPHMLQEETQWVVRRAESQPVVRLAVQVSTKSYTENNIKPPSAYRHRRADLDMLADTGSQAVIMGTNQLGQLGLTVRDLMECEMSLSGVTNSSVQIIGALFVRISGSDTQQKVWTTTQLCYVARGVDRMILSKEACRDLGLVNKDFPSIGSCESRASVNMTAGPGEDERGLTPCSPEQDGSCSCPRRAETPSPPSFDPRLSREELKTRILKHYAASAFNKCTRQALPMMKGEPLPIPVKAGVKPIAVHTPVPIPLHWEEKVHKDLQRDVALGVIEPVPLNTPVTWCSRMVVVPKHNGEPRRTVDLQALNKASVRQTHHTKSPFMLASNVPAGKIKSVVDVWNSFHSVPIREEDRDKTTFITPFGRFRYRVSPQGYLASMDGYTHRFSLITKDIKNKETIVDDTLTWSDSLEENFNDTCQLLTVCSRAGLIFNPEKFQFGQETVEFAGLEVTMDGVRPSRKFLDGIRAFPRPETLSEARSFFGMINQVSYSFSMSAMMEPFRHLLKPDTWAAGFEWTRELDRQFHLAKEKIIEAVEDGVKAFDTTRWTCLATDWSKQGIGFFLLQKFCQCEKLHPKCCNDGWKLVLAGGRFTKPNESRYSPVEGECLAVVEGLFKSKHFILGCEKLIVAVDHKPLLGILNEKSLADIDNPRLLGLKEKTLWFSFKVVHVPGREHCGPDYISRLGDHKMNTKEARVNCILGLAAANNVDPTVHVNDTDILDSVVASLYEDTGLRAVTFEDIQREVVRDREMSDLVQAITNSGEQDSFPDTVSQYNKYRDSLYVLEGVPMLGRRVIVPSALRQEVLRSLHSAHQCPAKMSDRARDSVFWAGITADLETVRQSCSYCNKNAPSQAMMPPQPLASPDYPFQMVVADYCNIKGKSWLVLCDRFSGWLSVQYYSRDASATDLVRTLKEYFSIFGIPEHFSSDDGPQFRSDTLRTFFQSWGVREHRVSAAYHPHSNLRAETAVKSAKRILLDNTRSDGSPDQDKIARALMQHRNTPDSEYGLSPAQLIFGRPIKDFLPIKPGNFSPSEVWVDCRQKRELAMKTRFSRGLERWSEHTRNLPPLNLGQRVLVQNQHGAGKMARRWDRSGTVIEDLGYNKYRIRIDGSGRVTDRNRQFLRKFSSVTPSEMGYSSPSLPPQSQPPAVPVTATPDLPVFPEPSQSPPPSSPPPPETGTEPAPTLSDQSDPAPESSLPEDLAPTLRRSGRNPAPNTLYPPSQFDCTRTRRYGQQGERRRE